MHARDSDLFDTVFVLRQLLCAHGRLLISLPLSRDDVHAGERVADGRLFKSCRPEYLQLLFERVGSQQIGRRDSGDALGRSGTRWYTPLRELRAGGTVRAVDQTEDILDRDKKVDTYKLALFGAMAELATQEPRCATWRQDGQVGVRCVTSDKLPRAELMHRRQTPILRTWQLLRDAAPEAFDLQATHFLGRPIGGPLKWEVDLFTRLREAIEIAALQRGVERWAPGRPQAATAQGVA